ncbi:hypothetical protein [Apilactobacillus xinyiensis]|uniref:hypothetical protein n=1 Tax=Apilactobacillus xinyiensis TaxID=2841032 RepID=UPI003364EF18
MDGFFGKDFYNGYKKYEKDILIYRNDKLIYKIKGLVTSEDGVTLPPSKETVIYPNDVIQCGPNKLVVLFVDGKNDGKNVITLKTERYDLHLQNSKKSEPSVINNVNSEQFMQNIGDYGNITLKQQNSYSINDLYEYLSKVDVIDKDSVVALADEIRKNISEKSEPKKGFLKRFDGLINKYPNISKIISGLLVQWATK